MRLESAPARNTTGATRPTSVKQTGGRYSDVERFAAAAFVFHIGVVELETLVQPFPCEVELGAIEIRQALGIDHHGDPVAFVPQVLGTRLVCVLELVGKPGAARGANAQPQPNALPPLAQVTGDVLSRAGCK